MNNFRETVSHPLIPDKLGPLTLLGRPMGPGIIEETAQVNRIKGIHRPIVKEPAIDISFTGHQA